MAVLNENNDCHRLAEGNSGSHSWGDLGNGRINRAVSLAGKDLSNRHWHVVRTRSQSERLATAALEREGYEFFFPRVQSPRPGSRSFYVPLFPGYLFVRCQRDGQRWSGIGRIPGIFGWVNLGGIVPAVPHDVIADLTRKVDDINKRGGLWPRYKAGERVRVMHGSTDSLAEIVEDVKSPQARVRVLLEFMGRRVQAQVPYEMLGPVPPGELALSERQKAPRRTRGNGRWLKGFGHRAP